MFLLNRLKPPYIFEPYILYRTRTFNIPVRYGTRKQCTVHTSSVHVHQEPPYGTVRYGRLRMYITPCTARKMSGTVLYGPQMYGTLSHLCTLFYFITYCIRLL